MEVETSYSFRRTLKRILSLSRPTQCVAAVNAQVACRVRWALLASSHRSTVSHSSILFWVWAILIQIACSHRRQHRLLLIFSEYLIACNSWRICHLQISRLKSDCKFEMLGLTANSFAWLRSSVLSSCESHYTMHNSAGMFLKGFKVGTKDSIETSGKFSQHWNANI